MIRIFGTAYRLHPLFVLLMAASVFTGYFIELMTLFGVVLIHELGHVAAAGALGWRVREVKLLPFGGVAEVEESSNVPAREEILVAIAGPLQNVWMALFAYLMKQAELGNAEYWSYFFNANVTVGLFNLLPIWPLDGGKLVHAGLGYMMSYYRSLMNTIRISLFLSVLLLMASVVRLPGDRIQMNLLLIGTFLLYSNWYTWKNAIFHFLRFLMGRPKRIEEWRREGKLEAQPLIVSSSRTPMEVFERLMREQYHVIYVTGADGRLVQVLPEERLIHVYFTRMDSSKPIPPPKIG